MDFSYSEEQRSLRELAARLLGQRFTDSFRKEFARSAEPYDAPLWSQLARAGLLGTAIGTDCGGSGLGTMELGLLLEEQGRTLAALPLLPTLVLGALPLQQFGNQAQRALLPKVAAGEILLSAALEEPGENDPEHPATLAEPTDGGWQLSGTKTCVPYGAQAHRLLVAARTAGGARLFLIEPRARGVGIEPQASTSGEPQAQVTLARVFVDSADVLGAADVLGTADSPGMADARGTDAPVTAAGVIRWTLERAQVALAAQQLGVVSEALRRAATYVCERHQFRRPIGSFQAVQHRLADSYIDVEALRSAYLRAVWTLDHDVPASAEVLAAKWWAARAGHRVTHATQHVHGGLGADVEYPIHAWFLRARQLGIALGGGTQMLAAIGSQLAAGGVRPFT